MSGFSTVVGLTAAMKNVASGIAGLDASTLLALIQQRLNYKRGTFTWDTASATGNQAVAGIGFTPRLLLLFVAVNNTPEVVFGWLDDIAGGVIVNKHNIAANAWAPASSGSLALYQSDVIYTDITFSSFDADGFTLTFTKTGAKTGTATVMYLAIR